MYFAILFLGIICTPTGHANESYFFVTQWSAYANNAPYDNGIALNSSDNNYTTDKVNAQVVVYYNFEIQNFQYTAENSFSALVS
jgi:hypothetical protein